MKLRIKNFSITMIALTLAFGLFLFGMVSADNTCIHHQTHDDSCGYVESVEEQACQHEHHDECYVSKLICTKEEHTHVEECIQKVQTLICEHTTEEEHNDECYSTEEELVCTIEEHIHDNGCYDKVESCQHQHDDTCGYREGVEGHDCTHLCSYCDKELVKNGEISIVDDSTIHVESKLLGNKSEDQVYFYVRLDKVLLDMIDIEMVDGVYNVTCDDGTQLILKPIYISNDLNHVYLKYEQAYGSTVRFDIPLNIDGEEIKEEICLTVASSFDETDHDELDSTTISNQSVFYAVNLAADEETETATTTDFTNMITSISVQHKPSGSNDWTSVEDGKVQEGDDLKFNIKYSVPAGTLSTTNNTITYNITDKFSVIKSESGYVFNDTGEEVGTYVITEDGLVSITFYDNYCATNKEHPITGTISFQSSVGKVNTDEFGNVVLPFNDKLSVNLLVTDKSNNTNDLQVAKEASEVNQKDGTVKYTITVTSENGTGDGVTLNDVLTNVSYYGNFSVVDKNNITVNVTAPSQGDRSFELTLPKMEAGDKYTITYIAKLTDILNGSITAKNNVTVNSTNNDGAKLEDDAEVTTGFTNELLSKTGVVDGDKIKWTIVINKNQQDISGWTLSDTLNGETFTGPVTISPAVGGQTSINLPFIFPNGTNQTYTITYETSADYSIGESGTSNVANLTPSTGTGVTSGTTVGNEKYNPLSKTADGFIDNGDGTISITWTVTIDASKGDIPAEWEYEDDLWDNQWFTDAQKQEIQNTFENTINYQNTLSWTSKYVNNNGVTESKLTGFKVKFTTPLKKGEKITFTYKSTAPIGDGSSSITFRNHADINNKVYVSDSLNYSPVVYKYDEKSPSGGSETYHDYYDDSLLDNNVRGTLKWWFTVSIPEGYYNQDIIITEYLPDNVTLYNGTYDLFLKGANWFSLGNKINTPKSVTYKGHSVTAELLESGDLKITLPKELLQVIKNETLLFRVQVKIDEDLEWPTSEDGTLISVPFKNNVTVSTSNGTVLGTDDQTQNITKNENYNVIKKGHGTYSDNVIPYSIEINPDSRDLIKGSDTILLKDVMNIYIDNGNSIVNATLIPGSLKVYTYDSNGNKIELDSTKYRYTYEETQTENNYQLINTNNLTVEIPDGKHLIVEYKYKVTGIIGTYQWVENTASLEGISNDSNSSKNGITIEITESNATANINGVTIYKVDSENTGKALEGAKFILYKWNVDSNDYVEVTEVDGNSLVTDTNGKVALLDLAYNTAYKLVEVEAPKGYLKNIEPYYFYIINSDTTANPECIPNDFDGEIKNAGDVIYYENTYNLTEISIVKKWLNTEGNEFTKESGEIVVTLYQNELDSNGKITNTNTYGKYTLSPNDGEWSLSITELPKYNVDKTITYTYFVEEENGGAYEPSYENNDGIVSGIITITNKDKGEVILPEVGGTGNLPFIVGGLTMMSLGVLLFIRKRHTDRKVGES